MVTSKTLSLFLTAITAAAATDISVWYSPNADCSGDASEVYPDVSPTSCATGSQLSASGDGSDITSAKVTNLDAGCSVTFYTDTECKSTADAATPDVNECAPAPGSLLWVALSITC